MGLGGREAGRTWFQLHVLLTWWCAWHARQQQRNRRIEKNKWSEQSKEIVVIAKLKA